MQDFVWILITPTPRPTRAARDACSSGMECLQVSLAIVGCDVFHCMASNVDDRHFNARVHHYGKESITSVVIAAIADMRMSFGFIEVY